MPFSFIRETRVINDKYKIIQKYSFVDPIVQPQPGQPRHPAAFQLQVVRPLGAAKPGYLL